MRRDALLKLIDKVAAVVGDTRLIIVGSQSVHGQIDWLPSPVIRSIEADFFFFPDFGRMPEVDDECGPESDFFVEHGIYADPLGAGIVTLPPGWEERLVPIKNDAGEVAWWALEIHDACATKLIAGRDKDFEFITALCFADTFSFDTFLERAALMQHSPQRGALRPRLQKLIEQLRKRQLREQQVKAEQALLALP